MRHNVAERIYCLKPVFLIHTTCMAYMCGLSASCDELCWLQHHLICEPRGLLLRVRTTGVYKMTLHCCLIVIAPT